MSDDECLFCQIVAEEIPARIVYEDDETLAFLDANPLAHGHTLVIPKSHEQRIADLGAAEAEAVIRTIHHLTPRIEAAVGADAANIGFNDGEVAGQVIPHVHGHIIPRFPDDGGRNIHAVAARQLDLSDEELDEVAEDIRDAQ